MTLQTKNEEAFLWYQKHPLAFINDLYTFDPRPGKGKLPFHLYKFQIDYAIELIYCIQNGEEIFVEKSRDMGASWVTLAVILWCWIFLPNFQALIGSRKEDLVDNGLVDSLFGKFDYMLKYLSFDLTFDPSSDKVRTYMKLVNPLNGNSISGESANPNFGRQGRYSVSMLDEIAFWPQQQSSWEGVGESTRTRIAITTPSEYPSFAKTLRNSGLIPVKTLHWKDHPDKDQKWYEEQKKEKDS